MKPTDLCQKANLCQKNVSVSQYVSKDKCDLCHSVITEDLEKLKDPDTELQIVKLFMKACGSTGKNIKKCKSLVIQYTPYILVHAQQLLETKDLCTILHACDLTPVTIHIEMKNCRPYYDLPRSSVEFVCIKLVYLS